MGSSQSKGGSSNGSSQGSSEGSTANTNANVDVSAFRAKQDEKYGSRMGSSSSAMTTSNAAPGHGTIFEGIEQQPQPPFMTVDEMTKSGLLQEGDPIEFEDNVMRHWALYAGQQQATATEQGTPIVVHLFSLDGQPHTVRYDALETAADGKRCRINKKYDAVLEPKAPEEILRKAHSILGRQDYNILTNNCEHFVTGCRYGFFVSEQVQEAHNSYRKQFEIARHVISNGFSTATYNVKGYFSPKQ